MKLKTIDEKGKEKYIEVGFWSFMKCAFLTQLALTGIVYGAIMIVVIIIGAIALMAGA